MTLASLQNARSGSAMCIQIHDARQEGAWPYLGLCDSGAVLISDGDYFLPMPLTRVMPGGQGGGGLEGMT